MYRNFRLNSGADAVSKFTSRRWWRTESLFPHPEEVHAHEKPALVGWVARSMLGPLRAVRIHAVRIPALGNSRASRCICIGRNSPLEQSESARDVPLSSLIPCESGAFACTASVRLVQSRPSRRGSWGVRGGPRPVCWGLLQGGALRAKCGSMFETSRIIGAGECRIRTLGTARFGEPAGPASPAGQ